MLSSRNATREDFEHVIAAMASGRVATEPLTARHVALEELPSAFPDCFDPQAGVLKAIVAL